MNSPPKILVVDDTPRNVKLLADLLAVKGYSVVPAGSGREALAARNSSLLPGSATLGACVGKFDGSPCDNSTGKIALTNAL